MKKQLVVLALIIMCSGTANRLSGQNYLTEGFNGTTFPPAGWTMILGTGANWLRVTTGYNPAAFTYTGVGMAEYPSYSYGSGANSYLITPAMNFSIYGADTNRISFWMYRDGGYISTADRLILYVNTAPAVSGATYLGYINRSTALSPAEPLGDGWYHYSFTIPASFNTESAVYLLFQGYAEFGNNIFLDDVSANHYGVPVPLPTISGSTVYCSDSTLTLSTSTTASSPAYSWAGPMGFTATTATIVIPATTTDMSGTYSVTVTSHGMVSPVASVTVTINQTPAILAISSNSPLCATDTLKLNCTSSPAGDSYLWSGPSSFSSTVQNARKPNALVADSGYYKVGFIANGCHSLPDSTHVAINPQLVPAVIITASPDTNITTGTLVIFNAASSNGGTAAVYKWFLNGVIIPGATSNGYSVSTLVDNDIVSCQLFSNADCRTLDSVTSNSLTFHVPDVPNSVKPVNGGDHSLYLFPNPANGSFTLQGHMTTWGDEKITIEIASVTGQIVYRDLFTARNGMVDKKVAIPNIIAQGVYFVSIRTAGDHQVVRLIVER